MPTALGLLPLRRSALLVSRCLLTLLPVAANSDTIGNCILLGMNMVSGMGPQFQCSLKVIPNVEQRD